MPRRRRKEPTRCAVQVFTWVVGKPMRFSVAATSPSDHRVAIMRIGATASSEVRHSCSPGLGFRTSSSVDRRSPIRLTVPYTLQGRLPALLELRGNEPVVWFTGGAAPLGQGSIVACLLQLQLNNAPLFALLLYGSLLGVQRLSANRRIHSLGPERQTAGSTQHLVATHAPVNRLTVVSRVTHDHSTAATAVDRYNLHGDP